MSMDDVTRAIIWYVAGLITAFVLAEMEDG